MTQTGHVPICLATNDLGAGGAGPAATFCTRVIVARRPIPVGAPRSEVPRDVLFERMLACCNPIEVRRGKSGLEADTQSTCVVLQIFRINATFRFLSG
jgi:hypothetical protein